MVSVHDRSARTKPDGDAGLCGQTAAGSCAVRSGGGYGVQGVALGLGGASAYSAVAVWIGDRDHCGVSKPVGVCAVVGGKDALGRGGEQLAELGAAGDYNDDAR